MRQQTKPFIVERKPSRKLKHDTAKPSIWGQLDLTVHQALPQELDTVAETAAGGDDDRR